MSRMTPSHLPLEEAARFWRAMEAAIRDRRAEQADRQSKTIFFFDADVVVGAVFPNQGVERLLRAYRSQKGQLGWDDYSRLEIGRELARSNRGGLLDVVVRALWCAGYGCQAHLLWSHLFEVDRLESRRSLGNTKELLELLKVGPFKKVAELVESYQNSKSDLPRTYESMIGSLGFFEFVIVEGLLFPEWTARRRYLGRVLSVNEPHGPLPGQIIESQVDAPKVEQLARNILRLERPRGQTLLEMLKSWWRDDREQNAVSDAVAIVALAHCVSDFQRDRIRFYTHTAAVRQACDQMRWWRRDAADHKPQHDDTALAAVPASGTKGDLPPVLDDPNGPFRSSQYMYLRMLLPALQFDGNGNDLSRGQLSGLDIDYLESTLQTAKKVILSAKQARNKHVLTAYVARGGLMNIITDSAMVEFTQQVWLNAQGPLMERIKGAQEAATSDDAAENATMLVDAVKVLAPLQTDAQGDGNDAALLKWREDKLSTLRAHADYVRKKAVEVQAGTQARIAASLDYEKLGALLASGIGRWCFWMDPAMLLEANEACSALLSDTEIPRTLSLIPQQFMDSVQLTAIGDYQSVIDLQAESYETAGETEVSARRLGMRALNIHATIMGASADRLDELHAEISRLKKDCDGVFLSVDHQKQRSRAAVACAWLEAYWAHERVMRDGAYDPVFAHSENTIEAKRLGRAWLHEAAETESSTPEGISLPFAVDHLLSDFKIDRYKLVLNGTSGHAPAQDPYTWEAAAWSRFIAFFTDGSVLDDAKRAAERKRYEVAIGNAPRISYERYWDDHYRWIAQITRPQVGAE
ncbi:MAG TPA: hypothetical protein VHN77_04175 [Phycisphaerales bacterium]|nr:hypothetical protein [Phycisphaerales bacterium]